MGKLDTIYDVTNKIEKVLNQSITTKNRESIISEATTLIEERGRMMEELTPPFSEQEKSLGKKIVEINVQIEKKMEILFASLKQDIRKINKKKKTKSYYIKTNGKKIKKHKSIITEAKTLIEERGSMKEELTPPFSEQEKSLGKKIVEINVQIEKKMEILFASLKQDIRKINKQKESNRSYINPYGNIKSTDGMYLDSKQ